MKFYPKNVSSVTFASAFTNTEYGMPLTHPSMYSPFFSPSTKSSNSLSDLFLEKTTFASWTVWVLDFLFFVLVLWTFSLQMLLFFPTWNVEVVTGLFSFRVTSCVLQNCFYLIKKICIVFSRFNSGDFLFPLSLYVSKALKQL